MNRFYALLFVSLAVFACKSTLDPGTGSLDLSLQHMVNGRSLVLNTQTYQNKAGESFVVSKFDYFLTNIRLLRTDGSAYTVPQDDSYFLVRSSYPTSQSIALNNIPSGDYSQLEFMIGVDSLRNTADVSRRKGVLDPGSSHTSGMYWDWNTGYIHLKLEGTSPAAPVDATGNRNFRYHVGLFGGYQSRTLNNLRTVRVPLSSSGNTLNVGTDQRTRLVVMADAGKLFDGPTPISIAQYPDVMVSPVSATIANNYATMFSFGSSTLEQK
ncbi:MbnP family protein [Fibrella sp. WM1]|uniref:MbnP family protein n=1 Tax=Fibrella musci TaxID=3242485 RepID=UPI0035204615